MLITSVPTPPSTWPTSAPTRTPTPYATPTNTPTPSPTMTPTPQPGPYSFDIFVTGPNGPVERAEVRIEANGVVRTATSDSAGRVSFSNLLTKSGAYTITITANGRTFSQFTGYTWLKSTIIRAADSSPSLALSGTVVTTDKAPIAGAIVSAGALGQTSTDNQGRFNFSFPYGTKYALTATAEDYVIDSSNAQGILYGNTDRVLVAVAE